MLAAIYRDRKISELTTLSLRSIALAFIADHGVTSELAISTVGCEFISKGIVAVRCMQNPDGKPEEALTEAIQFIRDTFGFDPEVN